jgi:hypothetical protein
MLLKIKQLIVENRGHRCEITHKNIYLNSTSIISIIDYAGADNFLLTEKSSFSNSKFSLIKMSHGNETEDVIAFGTADSLYTEIKQDTAGRQLLND